MRRNVSSFSFQQQLAAALSSLSVEDDDGGREDLQKVAAEEAAKSSAERPLPSNLVRHVCVGHGGYSTVWVVADAATQRHYALKQLRKGHVVALKMAERVLLEKKAHEDLVHPFIIRMYGAFQDELNLYFLLELAQGGDLFDALERAGGPSCQARAARNFSARNFSARNFSARNSDAPSSDGPPSLAPQFPEEWARFYAASIAVAIHHMHVQGYVYRDLKPENVLLDAHGYVRLADLGFAKKIEHKRTFTAVGTDAYVPPELVRGRGRTTASDWWALGVLTFEILMGRVPFEAIKDIKKYASGGAQAAAAVAADLRTCGASEEAIAFIGGLLAEEEVRLGCGPTGFLPIREHPWFKSVDWTGLLRRDVAPPYEPGVVVRDVGGQVDPVVLAQGDFRRRVLGIDLRPGGPVHRLARRRRRRRRKGVGGGARAADRPRAARLARKEHAEPRRQERRDGDRRDRYLERSAMRRGCRRRGGGLRRTTSRSDSADPRDRRSAPHNFFDPDLDD